MHPISELLCETYAELYKQGQVSFLLHESQKQAIDSVVKTVNASYFGVDRFPYAEDKAVAYLCLITKGHAVTDGNKRLAILWFKIYCAVNKLYPNLLSYSLDQIAVAIEKEKEMGMPAIMSAISELLFPTNKG